jgi:hypothetical protein
MEQLFFDDKLLNYRSHQTKVDLEVLTLDIRFMKRFEDLLDEELKCINTI